MLVFLRHSERRYAERGGFKSAFFIIKKIFNNGSTVTIYETDNFAIVPQKMRNNKLKLTFKKLEIMTKSKIFIGFVAVMAIVFAGCEKNDVLNRIRCNSTT